MSRLARQPIPLTEGLSAKEADGIVAVKGPKGEMSVEVLPRVAVKIEADGIRVAAEGSSKQALTNTGTTWALLRNAAQGVSEGFSKVLEVEGVGYRAAMEGKTLVLSLGFSHPIRYEVPEGVEISVEKSEITVSGFDKDKVGQTAAEIRAFRKPEPYKGKGIHYKGEVIRRKVGKKAATAAA